MQLCNVAESRANAGFQAFDYTFYTSYTGNLRGTGLHSPHRPVRGVASSGRSLGGALLCVSQTHVETGFYGSSGRGATLHG